MNICTLCIYDERVPLISFDEDGVCEYCTMSDKLKDEYGTGTERGEAEFLRIVQKVKVARRNRKYDCVG